MKNNEIPVPYPNDKKCPLNFVNYKNDISIITTIHKLYYTPMVKNSSSLPSFVTNISRHLNKKFEHRSSMTSHDLDPDLLFIFNF